ncbi:enoyl-CoA hydratase-related protein [Polaromonas sp. P1(28)-13]|nr:enoyl-CoA hydratase-related protein [Polaromonas sp. P1(28)-13]
MNTVLKSQPAVGVLLLTLNRPEARNAFNHEMVQEIRQSFEEASANASIRVVVLGATGEHFCAGGDIEWMKGILAASVQQKNVYAEDISGMYKAVYSLPQPLVAHVKGNAMGGGLGLVCCADVVVSENTSKFALSETRLGIVPAAISPFLVASLGVKQATQLALIGSAVDAHTAKDLGLVTYVTSADQGEQKLEEAMRSLLQGAPGAQRQTKALLRNISAQIPTETIYAKAVDALVYAWSQAEAADGFNAF